ncbi:DNA-binding transcriptional regulator HexR [Clostridium vincentii]|uniref:DNA-binding transcriptional regulator HexR n=2 Tax=Clostridium vincentii TaxID=52704 RepID=A0A2T0BIR4_9CLOT|nr:DNA-binding transcriptional regulator HexR [Clostridium vincentii]
MKSVLYSLCRVISMDDIIYRLLLLLNNSREKNIYHTIARTIIEDIKNIPTMNINKLAQDCYTTPSSVTNFCKKLGYCGFVEFKEYTENILKSYGIKNSDKINQISHENLAKPNTDNLLDKVIKDISLANETIDYRMVDKLVDLIYTHKNIAMFGTHMSLALTNGIQTDFFFLGKYINVWSDVKEQYINAGELDSSYLAIILSPSGRFLTRSADIMNRLRENKVKMAFITGQHENVDIHKDDMTIFMSKDKDTDKYYMTDRYALLYTLDYILLKYSEKYGN